MRLPLAIAGLLAAALFAATTLQAGTKETAVGNTLVSRQAAESVPQDVAQRIAELAGKETVRGTITKLTPEDRVTLLLAPDREMVLLLTPETRIRWGDKMLTRADLKLGMKVACVYTSQDGKHVCHELTIEAQ